MVLVIHCLVYGVSIRINGEWHLYLTTYDLINTPNQVPQYVSDNSQIDLDIKQSKTDWIISVCCIQNYWPSQLDVYLRRTSDGNGPGYVSGGTGWKEVETISESFFIGNRQRSNIDIQCGIDGISLQLSPDIYSSTIVYTITDL